MSEKPEIKENLPKETESHEEKDNPKLMQCPNCRELVRTDARYCRKCGELIKRNVDDAYILNSRKYTFKYRLRKYRVDNSAFFGEARRRTCFEVRVCPECKKINAPAAAECSRCGKALDESSVRLAENYKREKRLEAITIIGSFVIFYFLVGTFGWVAAAVIWVVWLSLSIFLERKVLNPIKEKIKYDPLRLTTKIIKKIDNERLQKFRNEYMSGDDAFNLTLKCRECGELTEDDSDYCSCCGKKV